MRSGVMPTTTTEDDKKHGDKLESLIDRTGRSASPGKPRENADDDELTESQDADDEDEDNDNEDADEDIQPDEVEDPGAMGR